MKERKKERGGERKRKKKGKEEGFICLTFLGIRISYMSTIPT